MDGKRIIQEALEAGMSVETNNYGEIIILTNLKKNEDGEIVDMRPEDFEDETAWYKA